MKINFIGEFNKGYVGEVADQVHLIREMRDLGHIVEPIKQDIWKGYVDGEKVQDDWVLPTTADINIITKWHHFDKGRYIHKLKEITDAPVLYWVWDYMYDQGLPPWHLEMIIASDLYLGNDVRSDWYSQAGILGKNFYYFPFDVADGDFSRVQIPESHKTIDVAFFGSHLLQGDRIEWLRAIDETNPVTIYSWNYKEWQREGMEAHPAVYGQEFANTVGKCKIILGFSVEPNCWGYWSNRVGKILTLGGFLLYQYAPGMELFLRDGAEYFSSIQEAREKIDHFLIAKEERQTVAKRGWEIGRDRFTSKARIKELCILMERFLKTGRRGWEL